MMKKKESRLFFLSKPRLLLHQPHNEVTVNSTACNDRGHFLTIPAPSGYTDPERPEPSAAKKLSVSC